MNTFYNFQQRRLAPQMATYQRMRSRHKSRLYPCSSSQANYMSNIINTDPLGFRYSYQADGQHYSVAQANELSTPVNLLIGNSMVFGIGASHDQFTLASCLNQYDKTNSLWLNFGINHANSLQELAYFLLHHQNFNQIKQLYIVSGISNLQQQLQEKSHKTNLQSLAPLIKQAAHATIRDLCAWQRLADSYQAPIMFFLQPTAHWSKTHLTQEEKLLSTTNTRHCNLINTQKIYNSYSNALLNQCQQYQVPFYDLNQTLLHDHYWQKNWVFIDNINCNDKGYRQLAKKISPHINPLQNQLDPKH